MLTLCQARSPDDLRQIYEENDIVSNNDKISFLRNTMKIRASRCDIKDTEEEELTSLEELALSHMWEGLQA